MRRERSPALRMGQFFFREGMNMNTETVTRREKHPIVTIILTALGLAIMLGSLRYDFGSLETPGAGFLPFFAGLGMAAFSTIELLKSWKRKWKPLRDLWEGMQWRRALLVTAGLILFSVFLRDLGFLLATMILMGFLFRILERPSWKVALFATLVTTFGFYLVFQVWLEAQLPHGFLGF
jgi:putative tricarboxylic transport membrane protein